MNPYLRQPHPSTFSIVGFDPASGEWGIAVQSKFIAVGAVVPWAKAGVGAVATQSYANTTYGPQGLSLLAQGHTAQETIEILTAADEDRQLRQVGIVSAAGEAATFTGLACHSWAGGVTGRHYCCQGNILVSEVTVTAMASTFEATGGPLAARLLAALAAGQSAGGDKRGQQSAALLVVKENGGYGGYNDVLSDLRVDDHPTPIAELQRIYRLHHLYFGKTSPQDLIPLSAEVITNIQQALTRLMYYHQAITGTYTPETRQALWDFCGVENLEDRRQDDDRHIDPEVLTFLQQKAAVT